MADPPDESRLRKTLTDALGSDPGELTVSPVAGGASREAWSIESSRGRWFLRRDPPAGESFLPLELEHRVAAVAAAAGVPVPTPLAIGEAGFLMEHVEGTSVAPRVLRLDDLAGARERLPSQLGAALARIHSIDPAEIDGLPGGGPDPALEACGLWEAGAGRDRRAVAWRGGGAPLAAASPARRRRRGRRSSTATSGSAISSSASKGSAP